MFFNLKLKSLFFISMPYPLGYSIVEEFNKKELKSIEKKKTRKNRTALNTKVEKFLQSIETDADDVNEEPFSDFKSNNSDAYARPTSMYSQNMNVANQSQNEGYNQGQIQNYSQNNNEVSDEHVMREEFNTIEPSTNYENYIPYSTNVSNNQSLSGEKNMLIEKLNYMIHLLEEQQEEKTGHVTEELILYSFLGVFVIFVVDSFARAGKYVR